MPFLQLNASSVCMYIHNVECTRGTLKKGEESLGKEFPSPRAYTGKL